MQTVLKLISVLASNTLQEKELYLHLKENLIYQKIDPQKERKKKVCNKCMRIYIKVTPFSLVLKS